MLNVCLRPDDRFFIFFDRATFVIKVVYVFLRIKINRGPKIIAKVGLILCPVKINDFQK